MLFFCTGCQINARIDIPALIRDADCAAWNVSKGPEATVYTASKRGDAGLEVGMASVPGDQKGVPKILTSSMKKPLPGEAGKQPWIVVCRVPKDVVPLPP